MNSIEIILLSSNLSRYLSVWLCTSSLTTADYASLLYSFPLFLLDSKGCVILNVTQSVSADFPSSCWGLQMLDLLSENNLYHSPGVLRNISAMCRNRQDIYGLLEVLYAAQEEDELQYEEDSECYDRSGQRIPNVLDKRGRTEGGAEYIDVDSTFRNIYDHLYNPSMIGDDQHEQLELENNNMKPTTNRKGRDRGRDTADTSTTLMPEYRSTNKRLSAAKINNMDSNEEIENISLLKRRKPAHDDPFMRSIKPRDWNYITQAGWYCRNSRMPKTSYVAAFAEVIQYNTMKCYII